MRTNQLLLAYPDGSGDIRTICLEEEIYFSLHDVVNTLAAQNVSLAEGSKSDGLFGLIKAQMNVLEKDEIKIFENQPFVTQPGLFRIILRDSSRACKNFQRWILHEVLPSIQKYGTYPPPLITQDSDVKRIVQSLLLEIEQREELERKTKEQFARHEKMLNDLGSRLENIQSTNDEQFYSSVNEYCLLNNIDSTNEQLIFGWCINICAVQSEPTKKTIRSGQEVVLFPTHVIHSAMLKAEK